ncbi:hypothetical protein BAS10_07450 [Elizabethkingia meningoseptica]|uniref:hypothetical protein n=1 Tax=Elizabethkingia meningoseptica TaxID=238 RepID=UPI000998F93B|nr:hypothetical protein [Elizabethkingia meningoseptica]OPB96876.1 hypothetical protein BAS10_07450 [Elizabethkingia meningoseptica]
MSPESENKIRNSLEIIRQNFILVEEELDKSSRGGVGATSKKQNIKEKNNQELSIKAKLLFNK